VVTAINVVGVRQATWTVDAFTIAKLLPLLLLIGLGLFQLDRNVMATQAVEEPHWLEAILLLMFAYGGFEAPLIPAGEARDPRRDSAFALLVALAIVAGVYTLVQLVAVGVVPHVAGESAPVAAAFGQLLGPVGITLASVAAMVSIYGYSTGAVLQSPRVLFSMAERGELPAFLARLHPRFRTPDAAILVFAALTFAMAAYGSFTWNATLSAIVRLLTYGATCVALFVFRRRGGEAPGFRVPFGYGVAPAGALFCLVLLKDRTTEQAWILAALIAAGWLLWASVRRRPAR
jgi:amino acid transporter